MYMESEARPNFKKIIDEALEGDIVQIGHRGRPEVQVTSAKKPALSEISLRTLVRGLGMQQAEAMFKLTREDLSAGFLVPETLAAAVIEEFFHASAVRPCVEFTVSLITYLHNPREKDS